MKPVDFGRISIFVLVDALGWELAREHEFLSDLLRFRAPVDTVLGFSSAAIPTILSGQMPEVHGHWCLFRKARGVSCFTWSVPLLLLPRRVRESRRTRAVVSWFTRRTYGISGYFCLYEIPLSVLHRLDYVERRDLWREGALRPCPNIFDWLSSRSIPFHSSGWRGSDERRVEAAIDAVTRRPLEACFLYMCELDATLHTHGVRSVEAKQAVTAASVRIRKLLARAERLYSQVELFVFSDHGMTPVVASHDVQADLRERLLPKHGGLVFLDSTMARFWARKVEKRSRIEEALASLEYGRVLPEEEKSELGLDFGGREYGDVVFLMNPGHMIVPSFVGKTAPRAMHGFHPSDVWSRACFLSSGEVASPPRHIKDIFSVFRSQLGLDREPGIVLR
ncbi:MAG: alkaline phosphatase family protein [Candidatus Eisenbacteria bacterium]